MGKTYKDAKKTEIEGCGKDMCEVECHDEDDGFYGHMKVNKLKTRAVKAKAKYQRSDF